MKGNTQSMDLSEIETGKWYWDTTYDCPVYVARKLNGTLIVVVPNVTKDSLIETENGFVMGYASFGAGHVTAKSLAAIQATPEELDY